MDFEPVKYSFQMIEDKLRLEESITSTTDKLRVVMDGIVYSNIPVNILFDNLYDDMGIQLLCSHALTLSWFTTETLTDFSMVSEKRLFLKELLEVVRTKAETFNSEYKVDVQVKTKLVSSINVKKYEINQDNFFKIYASLSKNHCYILYGTFHESKEGDKYHYTFTEGTVFPKTYFAVFKYHLNKLISYFNSNNADDSLTFANETAEKFFNVESPYYLEEMHIALQAAHAIYVENYGNPKHGTHRRIKTWIHEHYPFYAEKDFDGEFKETAPLKRLCTIATAKLDKNKNYR